jgi:hypothetical protein
VTLASSHPVRIQICGALAVERDGQRLDAGRSGPADSSPVWLRCGKAATATSCELSPPKATWLKLSAFTAS